MLKNKKVILFISIIVFLVLILITLYAFTGYKRTDVFLMDFSLSDDESQITLDVMVSASMGYVNGISIKQGGDNKYITFRSTWLNNSFGAKSKYIIDLNSSCEEIYFYSGDGGYRLVLIKDDITEEWVKVQQ